MKNSGTDYNVIGKLSDTFPPYFTFCLTFLSFVFFLLSLSFRLIIFVTNKTKIIIFFEKYRAYETEFSVLVTEF